MADLQELLAVSAMVTSCEQIVAAGVLPEAREAELRILIVRVSRAFGMPTVSERTPTPAANTNYTIERQLAAIREAISSEPRG
jgi:hypothetical protein